jgi:hypothetical protein
MIHAVAGIDQLFCRTRRQPALRSFSRFGGVLSGCGVRLANTWSNAMAIAGMPARDPASTLAKARSKSGIAAPRAESEVAGRATINPAMPARIVAVVMVQTMVRSIDLAQTILAQTILAQTILRDTARADMEGLYIASLRPAAPRPVKAGPINEL